jgi:hypothetical protein
MTCPGPRIYPLRKPKHHRPPVPRWTLSLPDNVGEVFTTYIGVQKHHDDEAAIEAKSQAISSVQRWLSASDGPTSFESFTMIDGNDASDSTIWVCYWTDSAKLQRSRETFSLLSIHSSLSREGQIAIGLWQESFTTAVSRLETNYSGLDYLPGLAGLPEASTEEHSLTAYWGAARDRIPDSAADLFARAVDMQHPESPPKGLGERLFGTSPANMVHIRSGQFWETCEEEEAESYEQNLEPTLRAGLRFLNDFPEKTGAMGVRYLRNADVSAGSGGYERKETCGAGFFANLEDLESWAKSHPSHLKIYRGALDHYKTFGSTRLFRTWHEVSVIRKGDANVEYINCTPGTEVIRFLYLGSSSL